MNDGGTGADAGRVLIGVTVSPAELTFHEPCTTPLTATASYSDGTQADVTTAAVWASSNPSVAVVDASGHVSGVGDFVSAEPTSTVISATYGGKAGDVPATDYSGPDAVSMEVSPVEKVIALGQTAQFVAMATFVDGTTCDVSVAATWQSSSVAIAEVSDTGLATAVGPGTATITASLAEYGYSANATAVVNTPATALLLVTPGSLSVGPACTPQFHATAVLTDGTMEDVTETAAWTSSDPSAAAVSSTGIVQATPSLDVEAQSVTLTISASEGGATGSATVQFYDAGSGVVLSIAPATASIPVGGSRQFTATGVYPDGSSCDCTFSTAWQSSAPTVATVSTGLATGLTPGVTTIGGVVDSSPATATLTVTDAGVP
jgi:hypothetical protein